MAHSSTGDRLHPYQKTSFWLKNKFWENDKTPQHIKDYYNDWLAKMIKEERRDYVLNDKPF